MYMSHHAARQAIEHAVNELVAADCHAAHARQLAADQDAAIARETMRHAVLAAHAGADRLSVEHVTLYNNAMGAWAVRWTIGGCQVWDVEVWDVDTAS